MLTFFRNFFKSKIGLTVALAFLGLIAFAFASSDVANTGTFGGVAGGDRVAVVGDEKIGTAELSRATTNALDRVREENPTLSMQGFLAQGGMDEVVDSLIERYAIREYAQEYGLRAGDNLVNSEIRTIPAFRGADGNFSEDAYRGALAAQRLTDAQVRDDLGTGLLAQQLLVPATFGVTMPESLALRYAQLFKERRQGAIGLLPSGAFAPSDDPSAEELQAYYNENRAQFIRPERRAIRFATFDSDALGDSINPTDAEIAARFEENAAQYAASEERSFTQLIVPTQQAANSIRDRIAGGASIEQVAADAGFRTASLEDLEKSALRSQTSAAVADSYFNAQRGAVTEPARSPLGWHVARVDSVNSIAARSLAEVREEIATAIREEKRIRGLADLASRVEEQIEDGAPFTEIAEELGLTVSTTQPVTADGRVYGAAGQTAPQILAPALDTAFQMDEGEPEVAALANGQLYLLFEVSDITESATAPLAEIEDNVTTAWRLSEGSKAARAAADRVLDKVRGGMTVATALGEEDVRLPPVENVNLTREQLARQREQRVPPPLALMFSMAEGTTKRLEAGQGLGWFVVDLDQIELDEIAADDPLVAQARRQLGPVLGEELGEQLRAAMIEELGVERNDTAIDAVSRQLTGLN